MTRSPPAPRPTHWPYRADPPGRYGEAYAVYQARGGRIRLEQDIAGFTAGGANDGDVARFYFFCLAFDQLEKEDIRGDVAELGTYKGHTATLLATMARRMGTTAWILDTFEGFSAADFTGPDAAQDPQFQDTSLETVRALVGEDGVRYVKGYFPESASQLPDDRRFALVHIDCDLYQPISHALRYFYPRLLPGGYLIVHDYASMAWRGAEQAVDEFFADKPEAVIPLTDGGGSVAIRKARGGRPEDNWLSNKRRRLLSPQWTSAGDGALTELLGAGWSGAEPWGLWGIGPSHVLSLYLRDMPRDGVKVCFLVGAALVGERASQRIDVLAGGDSIATWEFLGDANQGEREIAIPAGLASREADGWVVELEFRPRSVARVSELQPGNPDSRALGLALMALRVGEPEA